MPTRKDFTLMDGDLKGEYWENKNTNKLVILSHGFGVQRDSRGMFTELAKLIEDDFSVVMFDYVDVDREGNTTTYKFSKQAEKLKSVIDWSRKKFKPEVVNIVAHSQGCIITGMVSPEGFNKIILVAGPAQAPGERMKKYFSMRDGTNIKEKCMSTLKRSDGTLTYIPSEYWEEASKVNPTELYLELAEKSDVYFMKANQDQVVTNQDYGKLKSSNINRKWSGRHGL